MPTTWRRGGHKEQAILRYFEEHESGTFDQILGFITNLPTWGGGRRAYVPTIECIKSVMAKNGFIKKYEPKRLPNPHDTKVVYYRPNGTKV